jgi:hypothetical protein
LNNLTCIHVFTVKISDLKVGGFVNATYNGSTPVSLQAVKLTSGQLAAVDVTAGTWTGSYNGGTQTSQRLAGNYLTVPPLHTSSFQTGGVRKDSDGHRSCVEPAHTPSVMQEASNEILSNVIQMITIRLFWVRMYISPATIIRNPRQSLYVFQ